MRTAILSVTAPGPSIERTPAAQRTLARACNEYSHTLKQRDPRAYGYFACLPDLHDTEGALAELAWALDEGAADGVVLYTAYGAAAPPRYLGHAAFEPVWAELARRKAVVFVHPTHAAGLTLVNDRLPQPMFDYAHETARAAMDLVTQGTLRRHPGCRVILSHAGGTLPGLLWRAAVFLPRTPYEIGRSTEEIVEEGADFYYDTALSASVPTLKALFEVAKPGHVLFGSDYPNAPEGGIHVFTDMLEKYDGVPGGTDVVRYKGALELFPRLKQYYQ